VVSFYFLSAIGLPGLNPKLPEIHFPAGQQPLTMRRPQQLLVLLYERFGQNKKERRSVPI
jgi:hypothetical protein